jgi:uncharacterized FAD-dependent dehydrogenase
MIRISEIKLSLAQAEAPDTPLRDAAAMALGLGAEDLAEVQVFKRSFDARKAELRAVYIIDVALTDPSREPAILGRLANHPHVGASPDMVWRPLVAAPARVALRPVVVGFGPCGLCCGPDPGADGLPAPGAGARQGPVRQRTKDTWGLWRQNVLQPGVQRAVR